MNLSDRKVKKLVHTSADRGREGGRRDGGKEEDEEGSKLKS